MNTTSALLVATKRGNVAAVRDALLGGANANTEDKVGNTPLHFASRGGVTTNPAEAHAALEIIRELIDHEADVNAVNDLGFTPLIIASAEVNPEIVHELLVHGANPDEADKDGETPLHYASKRVIGRRIAGGRGAVVRELKSGGANVNAMNINGVTPLHRAIENDNLEVVRELIARSGPSSRPNHGGADIDKGDNRGWTPLHYAAYYNSPDIVRALLEAGANYTKVADNGATALSLSRYGKVTDLLADPSRFFSIYHIRPLPTSIAKSLPLRNLPVANMPSAPIVLEANSSKGGHRASRRIRKRVSTRCRRKYTRRSFFGTSRN